MLCVYCFNIDITKSTVEQKYIALRVFIADLFIAVKRISYV